MAITWFLAFVLCVLEGSDWNYNEASGEGPSTWSDNYSECGGDRQSPINVITQDTDDIEELDYSEGCTKSNYVNIQFNHTQFKIWNNGHGFNIAAVDNTGDFLRSNTTTIGKLQNTFDDDDDMYHSQYCLDSFHFHFGPNISVGSEHYLNSNSYPLEGHFVFYSCNYKNLSYALTAYSSGSANVDTDTESDTNVLAVIGIFFDVDDSDNAAFDEISSSIDELIEDEEDAQTIDITLSGLFGGSDVLDEFINSVYIYQGSLTTPPCYEAVLWHVSTNILTISQSQLESLYDLTYESSNITLGEIGNFRPLQDINNRLLYEQQCGSNAFKILPIHNYIISILLLFAILSFV